MKLYFILIGFLLCSTFVLSQNEIQEATKMLEESVSNKIVAGISAGYSVDGEIKWQCAKGYADIEEETSFELNTLVRPASIAKSMTAVAVMQLAEQDLIVLDAPIQTYISDYPTQKKTQITTRHLLSHTSGIDGYKNSKETETTTEYANLAEAVNVFKDRKLLFEPGARYNYTTYGYTVLGLLIEKVSGLTFEDYMQQNIWEKAGMERTGVDKYGVAVNGKSSLYRLDKEGKIKEATENNLSNRIPGGGFYTTTLDLLKFGNALLDNTLITEDSFDTMRKHHSLEKEKNAYGFGFFLYNPKPDEGAIIGHNGAQTGSSAFLFIIPGKKTVVVVLSNTAHAMQKISNIAVSLYGLSKNVN